MLLACANAIGALNRVMDSTRPSYVQTAVNVYRGSHFSNTPTASGMAAHGPGR